MKLLNILGFATLVSFSIPTQAQSVDEVINKHIDAIGGKANWDKVKTLKIDGKVSMQGVEISLVTQQVDKKAMRVDFTAMGMSGYTIITQKEGWMLNPFMGQTKPEPMTADDVKSSQDQLSLKNELFTFKEDGTKAEYLGTEDIEGTECHKIKMIDKNNQEATYFFDSETYYLIRKVDKIKANDKEEEMITSFSNFKKMDEGIVMPLNTTGGMFGSMEATKIEVNAKIADSVFKI